VETYELNTANSLELRTENWRLTVRSDPGLSFYYLAAGFVAMTDPLRFLEGLPEGGVLLRSRYDSGALRDLYSFDALPDLDTLAAVQGVQPIENIDDLVVDFWPEDESVEDFIDAAMEGRHEEEEAPDS